MRYSLFAWIVLAALAFAPPAVSRADTVHLKNGRTMDGIVTKETDTSILLDIGVGVVTLKKSQIQSIDKADAAGRAQLEETWKKHYFTNNKYAPKGFEDLAAAFDGLQRQRQEAIAAGKHAQQLKADIAQGESDIQRMTQESVGISRQLQGMSIDERASKKQVDEYNAVVSRNNAIKSALLVKYDGTTQAEAQLEAEMKKTAEYVRALDDFHKNFAARSAAAGASTNDAAFFSEIDARLKGYRAEVQQFDIAYEDSGHSTIVQVKLNDSATGRFVVDTGASLVSISRTMATRLNLEMSTDRAIRVTVADGRSVSAYPVILKSVQTGDARAENVAAVVLESEPSPGVDGLLGMTFLREFDVHLDAAGHRLELGGFRPGKNP